MILKDWSRQVQCLTPILASRVIRWFPHKPLTCIKKCLIFTSRSSIRTWGSFLSFNCVHLSQEVAFKIAGKRSVRNKFGTRMSANFFNLTTHISKLFGLKFRRNVQRALKTAAWSKMHTNLSVKIYPTSQKNNWTKHANTQSRHWRTMLTPKCVHLTKTFCTQSS